jgi:CelD/BcsL family acetyltransferase involved in cellulose biosynthesis
LNISILNPLAHPDWDDLLLTAGRATFFHTSAWARVLVEAYGYQPLYFTLIANGKLIGLIPVMEIKSFFTGKRGVSLPFTDVCHPSADTAATFQALMDGLTEYGHRAGWKYIEFRGGSDFFNGAPNCAEHFAHVLDLDGSEEKLFKALRASTRRNIHKAEKEGVAVSLLRTREALAAFYRLHCGTRRLHGLPPQPWTFFEKIYEHLIVPGQGLVALAVHQGKPVAGAVYALYRDQALYKFGASDRNHQHLRPNNLVMWEAIRWFCRNGFRSLDFGRTEPENEGLLQFKRGWGTKEGRVAYYRLNLRENAFSAASNGARSSYPVFKMLPIPVLRLAGRVLYRHVG